VAATELLVAIAAVATALQGSARADGRAAIAGHYYTDSDELAVWHPQATVRLEATDELTLSAAYDADVVSAATVDVRTTASTRAFVESRHGIGADFTLEAAPAVRVGGGVSGSFSPDYDSATVGLRLSVDDDERIHTLSSAATMSYAVVGRTGDQDASGELVAAGCSVGWAVVLSPVMVFDLAGALELQAGFLESPYRFVDVFARGDPGRRLAMPEAVPSERLRGSARARLRIAISDDVFVRGAYRFDADDWGVLGHTADIELSVAPAEFLTVTASFRFLGQRAASFYRGRYETLPLVPELRTRDRELAAQRSVGGGLHVELRLPDLLGGDAAVFLRGDITETRLFDTPLLRSRLAGIVGLGLSYSR
jgi:hypothetical protein